MSAPPVVRLNWPPGSGAVRHCDHKTKPGDPGDPGLPFQGNETPAKEPALILDIRTRPLLQRLNGHQLCRCRSGKRAGRDGHGRHRPFGKLLRGRRGRWPAPPRGERVRQRGADRESVVQTGDAEKLRDLGWGAATRTAMPRAVARRCVPISTASPATSQNDTPERSMMSSRTPGLSTPNRGSRSSGTVAMSSSPASLAMVQAGRLRTDKIACAGTRTGSLAASTAVIRSHPLGSRADRPQTPRRTAHVLFRSAGLSW
jgi:hypothetical protein